MNEQHSALLFFRGNYVNIDAYHVLYCLLYIRLIVFSSAKRKGEDTVSSLWKENLNCIANYSTAWGQDKMAAIFQTTYSTAFCWNENVQISIKISLNRNTLRRILSII